MNSKVNEFNSKLNKHKINYINFSYNYKLINNSIKSQWKAKNKVTKKTANNNKIINLIKKLEIN